MNGRLAVFAVVFTLALPPGRAASEGYWSIINSGPDPGSLYDHSAIYDAPRDRMMVFSPGGTSVLPMNSYSWSPLTTAGPTFLVQGAHTAIYDPVRDRVILFGGGTNELGSLSLSGTPTWSLLVASGTPPAPRGNHTAIYDPVGDRMIVFGGSGAATFNDTWELALSGPTPVWTLLSPAGTPPSPRSNHAAIYDPVRQRMIVFGPVNAEVWALSLEPGGSPQWTALAPSGTPPPWSYESVAIYEPQYDRMLVHGGGPLYQTNQLTELSLTGSPSWSMVTPDAGYGRGYHAGIYDPIRHRLVIQGGYYQGGVTTFIWQPSTWAVTWPAPAAVENAPSSVGFRIAVVPNPAVRRFSVDFVLPSPGRAVVELLDPMGRRLEVRDLATAAAGRHSVPLEGRGLEPGVYWVRVTQAGLSSASRVALIE